MLTLILAGGKGTRWNNHTGVRKHLLTVQGETIAARLTRQFPTSIVVSDEQLVPNHPWVLPGRTTWVADKFLSSAWIWDHSLASVLFVYGDIWIPDATAKLIQTMSAGEGSQAFGRRDIGELFAVYLAAGDKDRGYAAMEELCELEKLGSSKGGGWRLLRLLAGMTPECTPGRFYILDDVTEAQGFVEAGGIGRDFDYPEDWDKWRSEWTDEKLSAYERKAAGDISVD